MATRPGLKLEGSEWDVDRTSEQLRTPSIRRHAQPRRRRAPPGSLRRTGLAQLARFGLAITGKPLLELKTKDA